MKRLCGPASNHPGRASDGRSSRWSGRRTAPACSACVNGADIDPFFLALGNPSADAAQFPNRDIMNGDMNADGFFDGADIDPFFACLGGNCP